MRRLGVWGLALVAVAGCGPSMHVSEQRMMYAPARPPSCEIAVVNVPVQQLGPGSIWDTLAMVIVQSGDAFDPFGQEAIAMVRPKVCELGGEAIALGMSTGSMTAYTVLRKKGGGAAPAAPPGGSASP